MDPLTDLISLLRPQTALLGSLHGTGQWGVRSPHYQDPSFFLVTEGTCWFQQDGCDPLQLREGDYLLVPHPLSATFVSDLGVETVLTDAAFKAVHGDNFTIGDGSNGERTTHVIGGLFLCDPANVKLLTGLLPPTIHIQSSAGITDRLRSIIAMIVEEVQSEWLGQELILSRLIEIMLIEALRRQSSQQKPPIKGLLAGLADPQLALALRQIHADVGRAWTIAELASRVGMSRSSFARHFTAAVGAAPVEYLLVWRMALAKDALLHSDKSLTEIAFDIGYQSASAFSTAFSRIVGCSPTQYVTEATREKADRIGG
ncbi:MAG: AraC family transcriptional regulator [Anaerolineae bacterium]|nr:AraC family transcriptional regulator [Anaerolineae bacterium]